MKQLLFIIFLCIALSGISQSLLYPQEHIFIDDSTVHSGKTTVKSWEGNLISPNGTYRILNIMVNIIYDVNPSNDPCQGQSIWTPGTIEGVHQNIPKYYLVSLLDSSYTGNSLQGSMSRLYYESSFGNLILLGDYMCVDINESTIQTCNGAQISFMDCVLAFINSNGGLNTVFGHNSVSDYDSDNNSQIDIIQFICRNPYKNLVGFHGGGGYSGTFNYSLLVNGTMTNHTSSYTCQGGSGCGGLDLFNPTGIIIHEYAHQLFGNNTFHTSGGNHILNGGTNTIFGFEGGYGLMGAYGSGLVSCNGYERWRMPRCRTIASCGMLNIKI